MLNNKKNALQLFYTIAVWESDKSGTFLMFRLNCPIEVAPFNSWGKLFHKQAPLLSIATVSVVCENHEFAAGINLQGCQLLLIPAYRCVKERIV